MKKQIIFATGNQNKMREIREIYGDLDYEILSMKEANNILIWDKLKEDYANGTHFNFKITEAVPAGVVGYVRGIRRRCKSCYPEIRVYYVTLRAVFATRRKREINN